MAALLAETSENPARAAGREASVLPWAPGQIPLMLAPMQGLTNRALRALFVEWVRPDVVFTEFLRVGSVGRKRLSPGDLREAGAVAGSVPLVAQLMGHGREALVAAALAAQAVGARHLNLNLGCPFGRMTTGLAGGKMLQRPELLQEIIPALRQAIGGTFSVKLRAGYDDPGQVLTLLPLFEASGVDFLVLHPRTVIQEYRGRADHEVTACVVRQTRLPVIANGDMRTAAEGLQVLQTTGAAGLMLGRGAISDPLLFERLRGRAPAEPNQQERAAALRRYLHRVLADYRELFCGEAQLLAKVKGVLAYIEDPAFETTFRQLQRAKTAATFAALINELQ